MASKILITISAMLALVAAMPHIHPELLRADSRTLLTPNIEEIVYDAQAAQMNAYGYMPAVSRYVPAYNPECAAAETVEVIEEKPTLKSSYGYGYAYENRYVAPETTVRRVAVRRPEVIVERRPEVIVERRPEVIVERRPEVYAERRPEVIVERRPEVIAERRPQFIVEQHPEPQVVVQQIQEDTARRHIVDAGLLEPTRYVVEPQISYLRNRVSDLEVQLRHEPQVAFVKDVVVPGLGQYDGQVEPLMVESIAEPVQDVRVLGEPCEEKVIVGRKVATVPFQFQFQGAFVHGLKKRENEVDGVEVEGEKKSVAEVEEVEKKTE